MFITSSVTSQRLYCRNLPATERMENYKLILAVLSSIWVISDKSFNTHPILNFYFCKWQ